MFGTPCGKRYLKVITHRLRYDWAKVAQWCADVVRGSIVQLFYCFLFVFLFVFLETAIR